MKNGYRLFFNIFSVLVFTFAPFTQLIQPVQALGTGCASSSPVSGTYTATVCFSNPVDGSTLSGDTTITGTVSLTSTLPGTQRMVFYLDGAYLLTDYETPYTFTLPTTKWVDGSHTLSVEALLRDTFVTQQASIAVTFNNGITAPPANTNKFTPTTGRPAITGMPFIVAAGGDGASGEANAVKVSDFVTSLNPNLFLYLGDVYEKGSKAEFYNWYGTPTTNFDRLRSVTDPTIGNHEYTNGVAPGYFDYWDNIPNYYSYNAGGWHFISLNSNSTAQPTDPLSVQYKWLQKDLAAHTKSCTVVYYHHPLFNIGPEGPTTSMTDIWKLMAQYGVDIVINGHDHDYQRWVPLDGNGQPNPSGITEFVAGSAGHGLQTFTGTDSRVAYSNDTNPTAFGVLLLQLNKTGANFKYVNSDGSILDSGVIPCVPSTTPDTTAPTLPTGLSATASSASQVDLNWSASSDATGVAGYTIYRDGTSVATVSGAYLTYSDKSVSSQTIYNYTIDAFDAAGNHSAKTTPVTITTPMMPASLTFPVQADTYVSAASPASKYGLATAVRLDSSPDLHSYLRFNVQGLAGKPIVQAHLLMYASNNGAQGITAQAVSDNSWNEITMSYADAPPLGNVLATSAPFTAGSWVDMDMTPYITGEGTYSFGITTAGLAALSFPSRESGVNSAQLIIDLQPKGPDTQAPTTPTGLTAVASGATQVNLSWKAATDNIAVSGYTIYRNGAALTTVPGSNISYSDTTVGALTTNSYSVDAFDQAGNHSVVSTPVSATTPNVPSNLTLKPDADTYVNSGNPTVIYGTKTSLRVDAMVETHSYLRFTVPGLAGSPITRARLLVYANTAAPLGIGARAVADNTWGEKTTNYNNAPLMGSILTSSVKSLAGTWITLDVTPYITGPGVYSFALTTPSSTATSMAARETGANSPLLIVDVQTNNVTDKQAPTSPTGFSAISFSPTQVDLSWAAASDNIAINGYTIYRNGVVLAAVDGTSLTYSDTTAAPATTYNYTVDAFDLAGNHSIVSASVSVTTQDPPPTIPAGLIATATSSTQVDLKWTASTDNIAVAGYTIYRDGTVLTTVPGTNLTYSDTTILAGNTYNYSVDAFDQAGHHSVASAPVPATPPDTQAPSTPSGLTTTVSGPTQVNLSWTASTDNLAVAGYTVYRDGTSIATVLGSIMAYSDKTALPKTTYNYTVDAFDPAGNHSTATAPASATTPNVPASLTFSPEADTYVSAGFPTTNYGLSNALRADTSPDTASYLRFTVQGLGGTPITRARLLVYANSNGSQGVDALAVADNTWGELTTNYSNAPTLGNVLAISKAFTTGNWVTLDVTSYITGDGTYSLGLTTIGAAALSFASREAVANQPQLVLDLQNGGPDTQAPSTPAGLTATASSSTRVDLSWAASSDNVAVTGYTIYRDGISIATVPGDTINYSDKTALPKASYNYMVDAFDLAGNHSTATDPVPATTPNVPASLSFAPDADTYVNAGSPTSNFGHSTALRASSSPDLHSYLRFTVQGLGGTPITRARLLVYATSNGSQGVSAFAVTDNTWGELTVNYTNAPVLSNALASSGVFTISSWIALDVTPYITGEGTYNLGLGTTGSSALSFSSREAGVNTPQLVLDLQNGDPDTQAPTVPTGLTAVASNSAQVDLNWTASSDNVGVSGYTIYRDGTVLTTVPGTGLNYSDTTALAGHTYNYSVDAFDQAGNHSTASASVPATPPDTQAPTVPGGLTATVSSTTLVKLSWTASTDNVAVNGYTIYRDGTSIATVIGTTLAYSDKTVLPATTYNYTVDAFDKAGNHSAATSPVPATTTDPAPTVPTGLTAVASSPIQVDLNWIASTDNLAVAGYTVYRDGTTLTTVSGTSLTYSDTTVVSGHTYSYSVDAFDQPGSHSAASTAVSVTILDTQAPTAPTGLTATASSATQVDLSWTSSTDNVAVSGYTVYRDGTALTTVPGTSLTYSDKTALPKTTYSYTVDAFDQAGNHSTASSASPVITSGMPASLTITPDADTYVNAGSSTSNFGRATTLRASSSPDLHSYLRFTVQGLGGTPITRARLLLFANTNGSQGVSALAVTDNTWGEVGMNYGNAPALGNTLTSSASFTTGNWVTLDVTSYVTGEGTYSFGVTTPSSTALSLSSRESGANAPQLVLDLQNGAPDTQAPSVPGGLTATVSGTGQVNLSWTAASDNIGVSGYTIYRDGTMLTTVPSTSLTYSDTTALAGHTYNYSVDAFDLAGNHSAASASVSTTTPDTQAPTVPGGLTATASSATLVKLSWTASTDNVAVNGYTIYRDGVSIATVIGTTLAYSDKTVLPATTYNYTVDAFDKAGNHSAATSSVPATTPDPAPTVPTGLTAVASSPTQVDLNWTASTDNLAVAGYTVYRDGTTLTTVSGTTLTYSDTTVISGHTYSYSVDAFDQPGSHSAASTAVSVTTPDTQAPTTPAGLTATASSSNKVDLSWTAATDNVAVIGYTIFRDGTALTTVSGASLTYSDTTATPATTYNYTVDAFDKAGNHSAATSPVPATTPNVPASLTFLPAADTYVNAGSPTSNFGKATSLRVTLSPDLHSYLRFVVQGLGGKSIARARLLIFANSNGSQGINALAVADNTWGELTMNYGNAPTLGNALASSGPFTTGNWVTLDVTSYLTGEGTYSFGITTTGASALNLSSKESGANAPQLIIDLQ